MPDLTTTIKEIKRHNFIPFLVKYLRRVGNIENGYVSEEMCGMTEDTEVSLSNVLKMCGVGGAIWLLRCFKYGECCILHAELAELFLPYYEEKYPDDDRPRKAIEEVKLYYHGKTSKEKLKIAAKVAGEAFEEAEDEFGDELVVYAAVYAAACADPDRTKMGRYHSSDNKMLNLQEELILKFIQMEKKEWEVCDGSEYNV